MLHKWKSINWRIFIKGKYRIGLKIEFRVVNKKNKMGRRGNIRFLRLAKVQQLWAVKRVKMLILMFKDWLIILLKELKKLIYRSRLNYFVSGIWINKCKKIRVIQKHFVHFFNKKWNVSKLFRKAKLMLKDIVTCLLKLLSHSQSNYRIYF